MKLLAFLLAIAAYGQTINVDAGSASDSYCKGDKWTSANDPVMGNQAAPYDTLRYGASVSCDIPAPIGTCLVTLLLFENRPAVATPTIPASGPGLRIFSASANGVGVSPIDLFSLAGAQKPYSLPLPAISVSDGHIKVTLTAFPGKGNASIAGLEIACQPTPVPPFSQNADGSWKFAGDLAVTGYVETGFLGNQPARLTLRLPDGSSVDGTSGVLTIGACRITLQAGSIVGVTGCQ